MNEPTSEQAGNEAPDCPVCGLFLGPRSRCPECGARRTGRMSLRATRWAAVLLATVGLFLLYLMSIHRDLPVVRVADISPTMNFATVRIRGEVSGPARVFRRADGRVTGLRFEVDDGSGEIAVAAYRAPAAALAGGGGLPRARQPVDVSGSLSVGADGALLLRLLAADHLHLEEVGETAIAMPPEEEAVEALALEDLNEAFLGRLIETEGTVAETSAPRPNSRAPWTVVLAEGNRRLPVVYWEDAARGVPALPETGTRVRVRGEVTFYRGALQVRVGRGGWLRAAPPRGPLEETSR